MPHSLEVDVEERVDTLPLVFDDIGKLAAEVKEEHLADPCIPPTVLFVYHDGLMSALFDSREPYCEETADEVIATITRLLPELRPDAVAMFLPAAYPIDPDIEGFVHIGRGSLAWAMKVYRWRWLDDGAIEARAHLLPMPINGSPDGPMVELEEESFGLDPLFAAVTTALHRPRQPNGFFLDLTWLPATWEGFARPGGPLAAGRLDHPN